MKLWTPLRVAAAGGVSGALLAAMALEEGVRGVDDGCRRATRRDDKRLDAEAADERSVALTVGIGLDISLVPGQAERRVRNLDDKEIEVRIRRQP